MIQRMTVNLKGGAPGGKGRKVFFKMAVFRRIRRREAAFCGCGYGIL